MVLPTTPEEWLALAAETREIALRMANSEARAMMLEVAAGYEKLAENMSSKHADEQP